MKNNIVLKVLGDQKGISSFLRKRIYSTVQDTIQHARNTNTHNLTLCIALDYSGRWEILQAARKIAQKIHSQDLAVEDITESTFAQYLQAASSIPQQLHTSSTKANACNTPAATKKDAVPGTTSSSQSYTENIPDPDLLIRTGGEKRLSNFMLWQLAYTELYFTETLWPDCNNSTLDDAIQFFYNTERRYGKTSEQIKAL